MRRRVIRKAKARNGRPSQAERRAQSAKAHGQNIVFDRAGEAKPRQGYVAPLPGPNTIPLQKSQKAHGFVRRLYRRVTGK